MAYKLMIQGTAKGAGKSFIIAGMARAFTELGFKVCPFKPVEITNDTFVTKEGGKVSSQIAKLSFASKTEPSMYMNPVLLKPSSGGRYRVFVLGESVGTMTKEEYTEYEKTLTPKIEEAVQKLEKITDIILFEGDGNPCGPDENENDISNMGLAKIFSIPTLIVGDWATGGALASLHGTIDFLRYEEKRLLKGVIINRYSEDYLKAEKRISQFETRSGKKVIARIPNSDAEPFADETNDFEKIDDKTEKSETKAKESKPISVAIIKLPRMTNSNEFALMESNDKFDVYYVKSAEQLKDVDLVIIPGTKSTIPDLRWFKAMGFKESLKNLPSNTLIFGICGGLQMLGREVLDPNYVEGGGAEDGIGFLPVRTILTKDKSTKPIQTRLVDLPRNFQFLEKVTIQGQIVNNSKTEMLAEDMDNRTFGTYVHGFFENEAVLKAFERGFLRTETEENDFEKYRDLQFEKCGNLIERIFDMEELEIILGMKKK